MSNAKQVQLRGGTSEEHENFIGAPREITVDTTKNTIRVHDGSTTGGHSLAKSEELDYEIEKVTQRIADFEHNIGKSHNHDGLYSKLDHNHDDLYERKVRGLPTAKFKALNGYYGISDPDGYDDVWIRTTRNGLIPYQSGGYSSLGTSSWRFADGWFNRVDTKRLIVAKDGSVSTIEFPMVVNDPGYIRHIENNNTSYMQFCVSDDETRDDAFYFGYDRGNGFVSTSWITTDGEMWLKKFLSQVQKFIVMGNIYVYFNGDRPADAPEGSISFG